MLLILAQMLDLDGDVVGDVGKFRMKCFDKFHRMAYSVEKVRIAERNMLRAGGHLLANVCNHHFAAAQCGTHRCTPVRSGNAGRDVCSRGWLRSIRRRDSHRRE